MHQVNTKEMAGVPVLSKTGSPLGKVASFDLDPLTGRLMTMRVKTKGLMAGMIADELMISWDAIVEMDQKKVVVIDQAVSAGSHVAASAVRAPNPAGPAVA